MFKQEEKIICNPFLNSQLFSSIHIIWKKLEHYETGVIYLVEGVAGVWSVLMSLDGKDGVVVDALSGKPVLEESIITVNATGQQS